MTGKSLNGCFASRKDGHHNGQVDDVQPTRRQNGSSSMRLETPRTPVQRNGPRHRVQLRRSGRLFLRRVGGRRRQRLPDPEPPTR